MFIDKPANVIKPDLNGRSIPGKLSCASEWGNSCTMTPSPQKGGTVMNKTITAHYFREGEPVE
jgi:hypothetical protein